MENKQILTQSGISKLTTVQEIEIAESGKLIQDCEDEEIKQALRFAFALIGLRDSLIPKDEAKDVLIYFIKKRLSQLKIDELRLSFEYAVEKRTGVELTLFGDTFSAKTVLEVVDAFKKYKLSLLKSIPKKEAGSINQVIAENVLSKLNPETIYHLKKIGETKKKSYPDLPPLPFQDLHQKWFRQWDKLRRKWEVPNSNGRFINRYGSIIDVETFFNKKMEQLQIAKERSINIR